MGEQASPLQTRRVGFDRTAMTARLIIVFLLSLLVDAGMGCARRPTDSASPDIALLQAARRGDTASLQRLLRAGADVEAKDQGGSTALAVAANYGHPEAVKLLLQNGADPVAGGLNGETAFVDAARQANANKVELLLDRGADLSLKNKALFAVGESEPPTLEAAPGGATQQVHRPQQQEADNGTARFPLMDPGETARLLLERGASIEARNEEEDTPLIEAAAYGGTDVVNILLEKGAEVEARDNLGMTALIAAACDCAIIDMPDTLDSMKLLLEKGANVNASDKEGRTALMYAAGWGRTHIVQLLLDKGARIESKDRHGNTPLLLSASGGYPTAGATELLLARGANIEARNNDGDTALILAASKSGYEDARIVRLLLDKGADAGATDKQGHTALALALKNRRSEIVLLLRSAMTPRLP